MLTKLASGWNIPELAGRIFPSKLALLMAAKDVSPEVLKHVDKDRPDSDYDPDELKRGIEVELEHTNDRTIAKIIAKDHLDEIKDYYKRLDKLEEKAKAEGSAEIAS